MMNDGKYGNVINWSQVTSPQSSLGIRNPILVATPCTNAHWLKVVECVKCKV